MSNNNNNNGDPPPASSIAAPSGSPSGNWPGFTNSAFSNKHLSKKQKKIRTSPWFMTVANLVKMYVGIAFISTPKAIAQVGIIASAIGFVYIIVNNIYCVYLLLQARNRFKRETIIDICDLSARLYGEWTRPIMSCLLIFTNAVFLMCYIMYIGTQTDQLVCKTFMLEECGYQNIYAIYVLLVLLPIICVKRMSYIGIFSIFVLIATFISIGLILYMSGTILSKSPADVEAENHVKIADSDRDYKYFEIIYLPVFTANMMSLFEGNQMILNLYSEADEPQNFFMQASISIISLSIFVACAVGYVGYFAFGDTAKSVLLYNLPNDDSISITAKCLYVLTICGSFVLLIQPIFSIIERSNWYNTWFCPNEKPEEGLDDKNDQEKSKKNQKEGGEADKREEASAISDEEIPYTFCQWIRYFIFRILVVIIVFLCSIAIPNINILLTFAGAVLGTIVNIILPVIFYNRAYNSSDKNLGLEKPNGSEERERLLNENGEPNQQENREEGAENDNANVEDKRWGIRCCNIFVVIVGLFIGIWGLCYVIYELSTGGAKADEV